MDMKKSSHLDRAANEKGWVAIYDYVLYICTRIDRYKDYITPTEFTSTKLWILCFLSEMFFAGFNPVEKSHQNAFVIENPVKR